MSDFLFPLLVIGAVAALSLGGSSLLARRRRAALARGEDVVFRVRLAGNRPPYPSRPRRGRLRVGPSGLVWTSSMGSLVLDLTGTGIRPVGQRPGRPGERVGDAESVVTAADGMGVPLRLVGTSTTVGLLDDVLRARGVPEEPVEVEARHGSSSWLSPAHLVAAGLLVIALLGGAFTVWARVAGVEVTATVVSEPDRDDYCTVRWVDPRDGRTKDNGADCYWDVGDEVPFLALGEPLFGEVVELEDTWAWAVISAVLGLSAVVVLAVHHWRRRRDARRPSVPQRLTEAPPPAPVLAEEQLRYDEIAAAMRLRSGMEGWPFDPDPLVEPPSSRARLKVVVWGAAAASWPLGAGLLFGLVVGWTSFAGVWASVGPTAEVVATVDAEPERLFFFVPDDLEVTFPLREGGSSTTLVAVTGLPDPRPDTVRVAYDLDDPDRARALEHDGAVRGSTLGGLLILGGLGYSAWRWRQMLTIVRAERRARASGPGRLLPYLLVPDFDEELFLLLFDAGLHAPPGHVLELLEDVRGQVPAAGTVEVRGVYEAGEVVVPLVGGRELLTSSLLLEVDPDVVLAMVNNVEPFDEGEE